MDQTWLSNLAIKAMRICRLDKEAAGNHRQDMTGPVLQGLLNDGYTQVTWNSNGSHHAQCRDLNRQVWDLQDFLATTEYDAPLFSRSHPGDQSCTLTMSGGNLPPVEVDSYGDVDAAIGTNRPALAPAPVVPAPKVKTVAPIQTPKVEVTPQKPEQKIVHVPKEVHKQIKDPFEKQDDQDAIENQDNHLTDQEYLEWLKELEQEEVQESIPTQKELTDDELDEMRNFNKETSKKVPQWITGLFKG